MKYDFTSIIDRRGRDSIAVDLMPGFGPEAPKEGFDIIPMWRNRCRGYVAGWPFF